MKKLGLQLFLLTICLGSIVKAQKSTDISSSLQEKIPVWLYKNNVPAVGIGIIEDGKINYLKVFGELKKGVPALDNTIFNVASITKPVVGILTLKLVEAGQWVLDEPLYHYWVDPDVANDPLHKKLTTRHVLTHQTGFINWRGEHPTKKLTFDFEPGTNYQYSGEGFQYLKKALENKFEKTLSELSDSLLFKPLGMKDTRYFWDKNMDESRFACWHDSKGELARPSTPKGRGVNAAGSLLTTIDDFCKFSIYVINGAGLSPDIYNDMINPHVQLKEHYAKGLGWEIVTDLPDDEYALEHSGSDNGVQTMFFVLPKSKRGIVVLTNGDNGMFVYNNIIKESFDIGKNVLDGLKGKDYKLVTLSDEILEKYPGTYLDSRGRTLTIMKEDSALKMSGNGLPTVKLYPESESKFFMEDFDVQFEFINEDSLVVVAYGKIDFTAKRIKHPPKVKLSDDILERYVGTYVRLDNNSDLHVIKENDILKLTGETVPPMDLYPIGENSFFTKELGVQFDFIKDESDKITKMNVVGNGKLLCETKRKY